MKRARLIVLLLAMGAALLAALLAKGLVSREPQQVVEVQTTGMVEVLVAASEIHLGKRLNTGNLKWQAWPQDAAPRGYIIKTERPGAMEDVSGAIARASFLEGEPIKERQIVKAGTSGYMAAVLPSGMRAISTSISPETGAGGFILPGDHVDVLLTRRREGARGSKPRAMTVLSNVRVLAIDQTIKENKEGKPVVVGKTATLQLKPEQSELLAMAQAMGDLSLTLRSVIDLNPPGQGPDPVDTGRITGGDGALTVVRYGSSSVKN